MQPPPGRAAGMLAVPSAGDELSGEVSFLFADLDELQHEREALLGAARADAARAEQTATRERGRLLRDAHEEGERRAAMILEDRRARARERTRAIIAQANGDAEQVLARAAERTPSLVAEIVERWLEDAS